jgi:hypothetical protein
MHAHVKIFVQNLVKHPSTTNPAPTARVGEDDLADLEVKAGWNISTPTIKLQSETSYNQRSRQERTTSSFA